MTPKQLSNWVILRQYLTREIPNNLEFDMGSFAGEVEELRGGYGYDVDTGEDLPAIKAFKTHEEANTCGTAACLAGSAVFALCSIKQIDDCLTEKKDWVSVAGRLLGLPEGYDAEGNYYFDSAAQQWPEKISKQYKEACNDDERRAAAIALCDHFICLGKKELLETK